MATIAAAIVALAVAAHGLVPTPEVSTRIGEVPVISRALIQQAMVPHLPIQTPGDPEERVPVPEATGMASGQEIVRAPLDSTGPERTEFGSAATSAADEPSDPLGDLIKATMAQTPVPPLPGTAPSQPAPPSGPSDLQLAAPALVPTAAPGAPAPERDAPQVASDKDAAPVADETIARVETKDAALPQGGEATGADGKGSAPVTNDAIARAETKDAAPPKGGETAGADGKDPASTANPAPARAVTSAVVPSDRSAAPVARLPGEPPTLARGAENADREAPKAGARSRASAAASAALEGNARNDNDPPATVSKRRDQARKAIERRKHRATVEKRKVRRKAVTKSRAATARKSRKAATRVKRHRSRQVTDPAPRRGVVVVTPRRVVPAPAAPSARYLAPVYPQVSPGGYYLAPAGNPVAR